MSTTSNRKASALKPGEQFWDGSAECWRTVVDAIKHRSGRVRILYRDGVGARGSVELWGVERLCVAADQEARERRSQPTKQFACGRCGAKTAHLPLSTPPCEALCDVCSAQPFLF